jgi:hypothetical protein
VVPGGHAGAKADFLRSLDAPPQYPPLGIPALGEISPSRVAWKGLQGLGAERVAYDILTDPLTFALNRGTLGAVGEGIGGAIKALPGAGVKAGVTADQVTRALHLGDY